eukprot:2814606-Rhodomonas_salina.1
MPYLRCLLAGLLCSVILVIGFWERFQQPRWYGSGLEVIEWVCIRQYELADRVIWDRHIENVIGDTGGA